MNNSSFWSRLSNPVMAPINTWRGMPNLAKYTLYTRVSLQLVPVGLIFFFGLVIVGNASQLDTSVWVLVLGAVYFSILMVSAVLVNEFHPSLNTRPRRNVQPYFITGLSLTLAGLAVSAAINLPMFRDQFSETALGSAYICGKLCSFVLSMCYLPWMKHRWIWAVALTIIVWWTAQSDVFWLIVPVTMVGTVRLSIWTVDVMKEVERSRSLEAELRVTEERLRFAQELHDTLGQHLAAMSLKSELALALAKRGDDRLESELKQLQTLTRTSMAEMREVVSGYRAINLATEIEGAKSLLADASIHTTISGTADSVAPAHREVCAWLVREATTNVLRHSDATEVSLSLSSTDVRMDNNGVSGEVGRLSGLSALRQRAESAGMALQVSRDGEHFSVKMIFKGQADK